METTIVYVIMDNNHYTKEKVMQELIDEKYPHLFYFAGKEGQAIVIENIEQADEVWCFGDCSLIPDYIMAKEDRKDIWQMG